MEPIPPTNLSRLASLLLALFWCAVFAVAAENGESVVVVYNARMPESKAVADHYVRLRNVPANQVLGLELPVTEMMTRQEYREQLLEPLSQGLFQRELMTPNPQRPPATNDSGYRAMLQSKVRYAVLCWGVPARILQDSNVIERSASGMAPQMRRNEASVDTELALLPLARFDYSLAGLVPNPFYAVTNASLLSPTNGLLMVTRLDGPTPAIARGLVDKALEAEKYGLWGRAYFDARNIKDPGYEMGDRWMTNGSELCASFGFDTWLDLEPETLPLTFPLSQVAVYAGWYAGAPVGPFIRKEVEFVPGAFGYHLFSFSASTLRSAGSWVGALLDKGVTVTMGSVTEPFLLGTPDIAIFLRNWMLLGGSFGEAAYAADRSMSWQTTFVGDPLYRPFAQPLELRHRQLDLRYSPLVEWVYVMLVNRNLRMGSTPAQAVKFIDQIPFSRHSAVLTEKKADLLRATDLPAALTALEQALERWPSPRQKERLLAQLAEVQAAVGKPDKAAQTYERFFKECPDYPDPLGLWEKCLKLAEKGGDKALAAKARETLRLLSPPSAAPGATGR